MRIFNLDITRAEVPVEKGLQPVDSRGGWLGLVRESFVGAFQKNVEVKIDNALTNPVLFRCINLIASDVSKLGLGLGRLDNSGIWSPISDSVVTPVLKKPNRFQNRIQFYTNWMESKLVNGNAYIFKSRDERGRIVALYVLDPHSVTPLVADDGSVWYQLTEDRLSGIGPDAPAIPASEIIHDRFNTLFHPLVGLSPIFAAGVSAVQGLNILKNSANFFANGSQPGGILTAPGNISAETASRLKSHWDSNYTGANAGKTAVLGDGLKYEQMTSNAVDSQLIEQLRWSGGTICSVFGVPAYKVGVGDAPTYNNIEALNSQYYSQCLQIHIESIESLLDEGLSVKNGQSTRFNVDDLLRMDQSAMAEAEQKLVGGGIKSPDESRKRFGLAPVEGGDTPYLQQQNYSLAALAKRDAQEGAPANAPTVISESDQRSVLADIAKGFANA